MVEQLRRNGWSGDTDFQSHAAVVKRNGVDARFDVYHPDDRLSAITLYGECRDVTTTQNTMNEPVPPAELQ
ncbi:MAG: hypothetical protein JWR37_1744 [Mycobacterium sp.]|nr:hypothetical protein [Mycobacterium sp.]